MCKRCGAYQSYWTHVTHRILTPPKSRKEFVSKVVPTTSHAQYELCDQQHAQKPTSAQDIKSLLDQFDEAGGEQVDGPADPKLSAKNKILRAYAIWQIDPWLLTSQVNKVLTLTMQQQNSSNSAPVKRAMPGWS